MGAQIDVKCPLCDKVFYLRFSPGPENSAPALAERQLRDECPDHEGKRWDFWDKV